MAGLAGNVLGPVGVNLRLCTRALGYEAQAAGAKNIRSEKVADGRKCQYQAQGQQRESSDTDAACSDCLFPPTPL